MTTTEIVRLLHAKRAGNNKWQGHCPVSRNHSHNDRNPSLSIGVGNKPGFTVLKCQAGCDIHDIVEAAGLRMRDLCGDCPITPAMRQFQSDNERLAILERRHGLSEWIWALNPESRYWAAEAQSSFEEWYWMRCKLFPEEKRKREQEHELQRIIAEYGISELLDCVPWPKEGV